MITRGIIEEVIDSYTVKVRIPMVDRVATSTIHTSSNNLRQAVVSALPGIVLHLSVGDVVIVDLPDRSDNSGTILGYLYRPEIKDFRCDALFDTVSIQSVSRLPKNTTIGDVTPPEIHCLHGVSSNIQKQLDELSERLKRLETY